MADSSLIRTHMDVISSDRKNVGKVDCLEGGDKIKLTYGTNPKDYIFKVVQIRHQSGSCTILSDMSGGKDDGEKLELPQCEASAKPAADSR